MAGMSGESGDQGTEQKKRSRDSLFRLVLTSGIAITVLATIFQMQGRAYRESYLAYFNLNSQQFPSSASDLLWLTLTGWSEVSIKFIPKVSEVYFDTLLKSGVWTFTGLLVFLWSYRIVKANPGFFKRIWNNVPRRPVKNGTLNFLWRRLKEMIAIFVATAAAYSVAPVVILFLCSFVLLGVVVLILPFDSLGKDHAVGFCSKPLNALNTVYFLDNSHIVGPAYEIECNKDNCAVISNRVVTVVPASQIDRVVKAAVTNYKISKQDEALKLTGFCPSQQS